MSEEITQVSAITVEALAEYIRLGEPDANEANMLSTLLGVAKSFIMNYDGITEEELDSSQDFVIVVFILCQDMWDNRTMYVDKTNLNTVVKNILDMHVMNQLPDTEASE